MTTPAQKKTIIKDLGFTSYLDAKRHYDEIYEKKHNNKEVWDNLAKEAKFQNDLWLKPAKKLERRQAKYPIEREKKQIKRDMTKLLNIGNYY